MTESDASCAAPVGKDTIISALLDSYPELAGLLSERFGGDCATCPASEGETLAEAARMHGIDTDALMRDVLAQTGALQRVPANNGQHDAEGGEIDACASAGSCVMEEEIRKALETVRPSLQADGGDVELVGVEDGEVRVRLKGACGGCPMATLTLKRGIEKVLKEKVPGVKSVVSVK